MANIQPALKDWSTTEASNQPDSTDATTLVGDLRAIQSGIRYYFSQDTIASATTTDLGSKASGRLTVSGTTTITGLGTVSAGIKKTVVFSGILTLTHNGTSLILPGAANITTAANDRAEFESLGSGNWICNWYQRASGAALVGVQDGEVTYAKLASTVISGATAETGPAIDDLLLINDTSASTVDKITLENMLKVINGLTEDTSPALTTDFLVTYDTSAGAARKVLPSRLNGLTFATAVAASGASVDFNVSTNSKIIGIQYAGISYNASAQPMIQIGDAGGIETTSYVSAGGDYVPTAGHNSSTAGFILGGSTAIGQAGNAMHGLVILVKTTGNSWTMWGGLASTGTANTATGGGSKTLSDTITSVRLTTVAGTSTHDAGTFNVFTLE